MIPRHPSILNAACALVLIVFLGMSVPLHAATLLKYNFETTNPWTGMAGYQLTAGGAVSATASYTTAGTIDTYLTSTDSGGLLLTVNSSAATGNWSAGLDSGVLSLLTTNTRTVGFLTLSFSLSASSAYPVRVRIESYNGGSTPTGGRSILIFPAAPDFYQRYALDLDKMTPYPTGDFQPTHPQVRIFFELDSTANGTGWPVGAAHSLKVDNVNYSTPRYYVKPASVGGSDGKSGVDEANALATVQAAINKTLSGDNIIAIMEDNTPGGNDYAPDTNNYDLCSISKAGTPDAWIVCKNYPGSTPVLKSNGWQAFKILGTGAYVEIRGLTVRGQSLVDANGDRQVNAAYVGDLGRIKSTTSGNGISAVVGSHHIRVADNTIEYFGGANGGSGDRMAFENNIIRYNCWWMIYAGSGISFAFAVDWDTGANYRLLIRNNTVYGNECMIPWYGTPGGNNYSDGNGIIIDSMTAGYTGKTLIQNNVVFDNGGGGIHVLKAENVDVVHNTTYYNSASGVLAYPDSDTQSVGSTDGSWIKNVRFANNISFGRRNTSGSSSLNETAVGIASFDRTTIFHNRNIYAGGDNTPLLTGANFSDNTDLGRSYNPASLFLSPSVDGAVADFRLRSAAAARNYGSVVSYRGVLDHDGVPRSLTGTTDTGAYQTVAGLAYSPIFSPASGNYTAAQSVTLASDTAGAAIVYTTDGSVPTVDGAGNPANGFAYSAAIPVTATRTLKAIAWKAGLATSPAATAIYDFQDLSAVPIGLQLFTKSGNSGILATGGIFPGNIVIQPVTHTPGALMRYTTNGTDPTETTGNAATYTGYSITDYANPRYRAFKTGRAPSAVVTAAFTIRAKMGNTSDGTAVTSIGANVIRFVRFQATDTFSAANMFARITGVTGNYRAAIYADSSGTPAARLGTSALITNPTTGWTAFALSSRVTLTAASYYWLAIWSNNAAAGIYATSTGGTVAESAVTFTTSTANSSNWPATAAATSLASTDNYAIYAANLPPNLAPVVNAGSNQSILISAAANLAGTVSDDGVPLAPGTLTTAWSKLSGPGSVTFGAITNPVTTATFTAEGSYTLRLTARDALLTSTSDVLIDVGASTQYATTTLLTTSGSPTDFGAIVTFTATVSSISGTPSGTVNFADGVTTIGSATLNASGMATFPTNALAAGSHSITATYLGASAYLTSNSSPLSQTVVIPLTPIRILAINSAGNAIAGSGFIADTSFTGGAVISTTNPIDRSGVIDSAPENVYQTERYGTSFTYNLTGLAPSSAYRVRLHFSENWWGVAGRGGVAETVGKRFINASINGTPRLASFDIRAAAGASNKAIVREFQAASSSTGQLTINTSAASGSPDVNALLDGLEVYTSEPFDAWRVIYFTPAQLDNFTMSGLTGDFDGDGLVHLLEYALSLDPKTSDAGSAVTVAADPDGILSLSFLRARPELVYEVEASSNLGDWTTLETNPGMVGEIVTVADTPPPGNAARYLRLRITQP